MSGTSTKMGGDVRKQILQSFIRAAGSGKSTDALILIVVSLYLSSMALLDIDVRCRLAFGSMAVCYSSNEGPAP